MRVAKNRAEIEATKSAMVADLTLSEATALLMLSSDVRKLLAFVKQCEGLEGEELVQACLDASVGVVVRKNYEMFAGLSDDERREWKLFGLWLTRQGFSAENADHHVEWLLRTGDDGVAGWLGPDGDRYRAQLGWKPFTDAGKAAWSAFSASHALHSESEIEAAFSAAAEAQENAAPWLGRPQQGKDGTNDPSQHDRRPRPRHAAHTGVTTARREPMTTEINGGKGKPAPTRLAQ